MPRRSSAEYHHDHQSGHAGGAHHPGRRRPADYTLVHAGRRLRVAPIVFWIVVGTLVIMAVWSITTATYFAFREDVLTRLVARQADMQSGYEDRIAELRAQIDRISGRQLLDQEQYEQKLDQILRRQSALESRAGALNGIGDAPSLLRQPGRGGASGEPRAAPIKGSLIKDKGALLQPERTEPVDPRTRMFVASAGGPGGVITRLNASLDRVEQRQSTTVNSLADTYDAKARRMRGVLAELGVDVGKIRPGAAGEVVVAMGGPFVPLPVAKDAMSFERQVQRVKVARADIARFTRTLGTLPVRKPLDDIDLMSGFGVRTDPFTGSPAMHTGLDLHGETGDPVRATADGTVTAAGWGGGYGRVVDIDHGNGLTTRYGHLSAIDVRVGQSVRAGQIIGKVGSTGRSTGPHLHYETRLRKEAVDPQKFLRAGQRLDGSI
jgi:murein DD-endopeptidase MepM/ murein hydrolase activator NlpD